MTLKKDADNLLIQVENLIDAIEEEDWEDAVVLAYSIQSDAANIAMDIEDM